MFTTFRGGQSGAWRVMWLARGQGRAADARRQRCRSSIRHRSRCRSCPRRPPGGWRASSAIRAMSSARRRRRLRRCRPRSAARRQPAAALIPIKKSAAWWELTQEERRKIFEDKSQHIAASLKYLPGDRAAALSLPRSRRALRFPDLVRIRARTCRAVRGTGRHAPRHRGMDFCRARSRCARWRRSV